MTLDCFDLHEDDWGMIDLLPAENHAQAQAVVAEAVAHAEAHRAPDGLGYTAMYIAPEPQVPLAARALSLSTLQGLLGPAWGRFARVASGYSSYREELPQTFAFTNGQSVLYGHQRDGLVQSLHLHRPADNPELLATRYALGQTLRLILEDLWRDEVFALGDREALAHYLHRADDEHTRFEPADPDPPADE
jgi:hypothetical protein